MHLIKPMAEQYHVRVNFNLEDCANYTVMADKTRLKQVILNLCSNAVKYNRKGGTLSIHCEELATGKLRIKFTDTGYGIDAKAKKDIFTAFNRLGAEATSIEGTGIGLVITKNLVELMQGSIDFESIVNEGSSFWIELPLAVSESDESLIEEIQTSQVEEDWLGDREYTIVYIEDNLPNLRLVQNILAEYSNIRLHVAHDGKTGIALCEKVIPDLILLDLNLPELDGYEILLQLKRIRNLRDKAIVAISANAMEHDIEKGMQAGFDEYIAKPIDLKLFLQTLQCLLTSQNDVGKLH
jgi:CheY-like chemotaxis protein